MKKGASKNHEVILNGAAAWAQVVGRRAVKDPVSYRMAEVNNCFLKTCPQVTGFFGCTMPAAFAHRALLRLRMTDVLVMPLNR